MAVSHVRPQEEGVTPESLPMLAEHFLCTPPGRPISETPGSGASGGTSAANQASTHSGLSAPRGDAAPNRPEQVVHGESGGGNGQAGFHPRDPSPRRQGPHKQRLQRWLSGRGAAHPRAARCGASVFISAWLPGPDVFGEHRRPPCRRARGFAALGRLGEPSE